MVKFYSSTFNYDYSFPAVSLAYFLRYPNPYSTHVISTDVVERNFDSATQRLTTVRLHLKRSKLPAAVLKILPHSLLGANEKGDSQAYILERSVVDIKQGWMTTESRNLEWTGVLSVIETQDFRRNNQVHWDAAKGLDQAAESRGTTHVATTITMKSHIGDNMRKRRAAYMDSTPTTGDEKLGFFRSWTTRSIQKSVEMIGLHRAEGAQPKAKEGMKVVLERLRQGGLAAVLEGMRRDRELGFPAANSGNASASRV